MYDSSLFVLWTDSDPEDFDKVLLSEEPLPDLIRPSGFGETAGYILSTEDFDVVLFWESTLSDLPRPLPNVWSTARKDFFEPRLRILCTEDCDGVLLREE